MKSITAIEVTGDAHEVGRAHALATMHVAEDVVRWAEEALQERPPTDSASREKLAEVERALSEHSPDTLGQIAGMAEVYGLPSESMLNAVLGSFFASTSRAEGLLPDQGCTTFALTGDPSDAIVVKNRDTNPRYLHMQTLLSVHPPTGHAWTALSTAGAPGVHSAGMNAVGLAVADTHVPSTDIGPGLPRFSLMMEMLTRCSTVKEAIAYSESVPVMGFGNIILGDAGGECAVIECGFTQLGIVVPEDGFVVATNHFVSPQLKHSCLEPASSRAGVDSRMRHEVITQALHGNQVDARVHPLDLMSLHTEDDQGSLCVHKTDGSSTIATAIFRPGRRLIEIGAGYPCTTELFETTVQ